MTDKQIVEGLGSKPKNVSEVLKKYRLLGNPDFRHAIGELLDGVVPKEIHDHDLCRLKPCASYEMGYNQCVSEVIKLVKEAKK